MEAGDGEEESLSGGEHHDDRSEEPDEPSSPEQTKRTRPSRACDSCRKKKVKCEGNPCSNCRSHKTVCTFDLQNRKRPPRKDHKWVAKFEARVQRLETRFAEKAPEAWAVFKAEEGGSPRDARRHIRGRRSEVDFEQTTQALPVGGLFLDEGEEFGAYLGPTSPWTFLYDTRSYSKRASQVDIPAAAPLYLSLNAYQSGLSSTLQPSHYTPLTKEQTTPFVDAWFTHAKSAHGYLHRPTFEAMTATIHPPNTRVSWELKCLYHAVVGLGAWLLGDIRRCVQFLQISWSSFASNVFASQNLQAVQAAHLLAYLLSMVGRHGIAYGVLGHAIRLAHANGIFRDRNVQRMDGRLLTVLEIEQRRRTFWGIYHLDAVLSIMLGRPSTFIEFDIACDLPLSINDSKVTAQGISPEDIDDEIEINAYYSLQTLAEQFRKIYKELYSAEATEHRSQESLGVTIYNTDLDLSGWRASQPLEYRPFMSAENPEVFQGASAMQTYFSVAYYYGQCLIHRPALVEEMGNTERWHQRQASAPVSPSEHRSSLRSPLFGPKPDTLKISADRCVVAARDVFRLLLSVSITEIQFPLLPACSITGGTILVDNILRDPFAETVDDDLRLLQNIRRLMENFDRFMSHPMESALIELENFVNVALHRPILSLPTAVQLSDAPPQPYFAVQPEISGPWDQGNEPYVAPDERYVAGPIAPYGMPFPQPSQPPSQSTSSYDFTIASSISPSMMYPFQRPDTGPAGLQHYGQVVPPSTSMLDPQQSLQSPLQQGIQQQWGPQFIAEFPAATAENQQGQGQAWAGMPGQVGQTSPQRSGIRQHRGKHQKRPSRSRGPPHQ